ncbi:hypothetical protein I79_024507 [Cricetulus griseus]|uniref:Uncharacterized protein n=1 Tax=Cricetulus griseus TaxID=10029 RepID=G3IKV3_CRIGR|nr:hypothetical protein I79_024507 [Cricetulus griseus]
MAQWLRTLIASRGPSSPRGSSGLFWTPQQWMHMVHRHTCRQNTHAHSIKIQVKHFLKYNDSTCLGIFVTINTIIMSLQLSEV